MKLMTVLSSVFFVGIANAGVAFDIPARIAGTGLATVDGSWYGLATSAKIEAKHNNGLWYPLGQSLTSTSSPSCPSADIEYPAGSGTWVSPCYWGWNNADMETTEGLKARVTLSEFVNPTGWGYSNAGFVYIFEGSMMVNAIPKDIGTTLTIKAKIASGKTAKVYLFDAGYNNLPGENLYKADVIGTGALQEYVLPRSSFKSFGTNSLQMNQVKAVFLQYEIGASTAGAPFPGQLQEELLWASLRCDGSACSKAEPTPIQNDAMSTQPTIQFVNGVIRLHSTQAQETSEFTLLNLQGKSIMHQLFSGMSATYLTHHLPAGRYIAQIKQKQKMILTKEIVLP